MCVVVNKNLKIDRWAGPNLLVKDKSDNTFEPAVMSMRKSHNLTVLESH